MILVAMLLGDGWENQGRYQSEHGGFKTYFPLIQRGLGGIGYIAE